MAEEAAPFSDQGFRLRAARLCAGRYAVSAVAIELGVNDATYRAAESGRRSGEIVRIAVDGFGVSRAFLEGGAVHNDHDFISAGVALSLQRAEIEGVRWLPSGPHHRLRSARISAGYPSAMAAAAAFDWSVTTYGVHESGRRPIPIDQFFRYAAAFGVGHDLLLFGEGAGGRNEQEMLPVLERASGPLLFEWPWIVTDRMSILKRTRRRFKPAGNEALRVASGHVASLAVMEKTLAGSRAHLLAPPDAKRGDGVPPERMESKPRWLVCDGQDLFEYHEPRGFFEDPLLSHGSKFRPVLLGRLLHTYDF